MKKCPFCNADIEENARFCLYCMNSLEEKQVIETPKENKKRWLIMLIAILLLVLFIILTIFLLKENAPDSKQPSSPKNIIEKVLKKDEASVDSPTEVPPTDEDNIPKQSSETSVQDQKPTGSTTQNNSTTNNNPNSNTTTGSSGTGTEAENNTPSTPSNPVPDSDVEKPVTPNPNPGVTAVTYLYRDAKYGDDFSVSANLENAVVITGVSTPSSNGEYIIPDTINNKKVIAIMGLSFCDNNIKNTVKKVVVPASVKTIWNNAFENCYNLTDIYFCGNAIYVEGNAFAPKSNRNGTLIIHCSYDCSDRNFRYYRNSATYYDAKYEEWNN